MKDEPKYGFWPYMLPFAVFMVISMFEPRFPTQQQDVLAADLGAGAESAAADEYVVQERKSLATRFFVIYGIKVLVTSALLVYFAGLYLKQFPVSVTAWSVVTGVAGFFVWIGICSLGLETYLAGWFTGEFTSPRSQFNPFAQLPDQSALWTFLAIRFLGLVVMVPVCEELFLRGFLMRFVESPNWWTISLSRLSTRTMLVAPAYGILTHPTEALAAVVWFSLVTWLVNHTGRLWDAVVAHAITNLMLGVYICLYSQWQLW